MNEYTRNIPSLTGLRGIAALWVFARHYTNGDQGDGFWSDIAFHGGTNGVIIFFVLSGFILSHVYGDNFAKEVRIADYLKFIYCRIARICPLHLFTLMLWLLIFGVMVPGPGLPDMTSFTFVLNIFLVHAWGLFPDYSWNAPSWTISVEWALYLIFPLVALRILRLRRYWAPVAVILAAISALYFAPGILTGSLFGFGNLVKYGLMFVCGMAAYSIAIGINRESLSLFASNLMATLGVGLLLLTCSLGAQNWLTTLSAAILTIGLYPNKSPAHLLFGNRVAVFFGDISYSLYMIHIMIIVLLPSNWPTMCVPTIVVLASAICYHTIERPSRSALRGIFAAQRKSAIARA
jgi:peptidoglycan/LPS O-acetylase OafA/YrhL